MSLSCGCDYGDGPSVFRTKTVTARKPHKCYECGCEIQPGEQYQYVFGVWEYKACSFHICEPCDDLSASLEALGFCISYGDLKAAHQEYIDEYAPKQSQ